MDAELQMPVDAPNALPGQAGASGGQGREAGGQVEAGGKGPSLVAAAHLALHEMGAAQHARKQQRTSEGESAPPKRLHLNLPPPEMPAPMPSSKPAPQRHSVVATPSAGAREGVAHGAHAGHAGHAGGAGGVRGGSMGWGAPVAEQRPGREGGGEGLGAEQRGSRAGAGGVSGSPSNSDSCPGGSELQGSKLTAKGSTGSHSWRGGVAVAEENVAEVEVARGGEGAERAALLFLQSQASNMLSYVEAPPLVGPAGVGAVQQQAQHVREGVTAVLVPADSR